MAAIFNSDPAKVDKLMKQSDQFKDIMGYLVQQIEKIGRNPEPSGSPIQEINAAF